jgi:hypothetical protein
VKSSCQLDTPALLRILDAAGVKLSRPHIDKEALARCIEVCLTLYEHAKLFKGQTIQKKQRNELKEVRDAAYNLRSLLTAKTSSTFAEDHALVLATVSTLISDLERLIDLRSLSTPTTGLESDYIDALAYEDHFKAKSAFQWMVGVYLREVYEIFVDQRAAGKNYVAFAYQVLKELKIKDGRIYHSPDSIARAARGYRRYRKSAPRLDQLEWDLYRETQFCWACGVRDSLHPSVEMRKREQEMIDLENKF